MMGSVLALCPAMPNDESQSLLTRQVTIPSRRHLWLFLFCCVTASSMSAAFVVTKSIRQVNVHLRVHPSAPMAQAAPLTTSDACATQLCACPTTSMHAVVTQSEVRAFLNADAANISQLAVPRLAPTFSHGVAVGFKLYAIAPQSIWARIGLLNGDTIHKVQNAELHKPDEAFEMFRQLKIELSEIHVDLSRGGCAATLDLSIVGD